MILLGIDTATAACSVCVLADGSAVERSPEPARLLERPRTRAS